MHETDEHPPLDLLHRGVLGQVGPDAPVLLGRVEHVVVDPAAVGRLQERMVQEQDEPTARAQHPRHLGHGRVDGVDVLEHETGHDGVERVGPRRQMGRVTECVVRATGPASCFLDLVVRGIDPHHQLGPELGHHASHLAFAGPHLEHTGEAGQPFGGQRQDLLAVLRVSALGELALPPPRVLLPQITHRCHRGGVQLGVHRFGDGVG